MNPWRSRQPAHKQIQAMRETAHSFRKSTAQRRPRSPQKNSHSMVFFTLCYSHHPSVSPVIKSESTLGLSEVLVYGLPVSNGFMLPVRITRGYLYWAPCVSAPRLSIARFRTRAARDGYVHAEDAAPRAPLSVPPWLLPCECWAVACARVCGPGGIGPGYVCRTEE
jgi:hypothetical protein